MDFHSAAGLVWMSLWQRELIYRAARLSLNTKFKVSNIIQPDLIVNRAHFRFMVPFLNCKKNTQTSFIFCSKNGFCPRGSPGAVPLHPGEEPNDHVQCRVLSYSKKYRTRSNLRNSYPKTHVFENYQINLASNKLRNFGSLDTKEGANTDKKLR